MLWDFLILIASSCWVLGVSCWVHPNEIPIPPTTCKTKSHGRQMLIKKWSFSTCKWKLLAKNIGHCLVHPCFFSTYDKNHYTTQDPENKNAGSKLLGGGGNQLNQHRWQLPKNLIDPWASIVKSEKWKNPNRGSFEDPRCKVGKPEELWWWFFLQKYGVIILKGLVEYCWISIVLSPLSKEKPLWISNAFHFLHLQSKLMRTWRPGYFELQNVWSLKVGFHSSMWVGCSGCFVWLVGVDAEITRILRWWDFTCGNVGRVRVVAFSILQKKGFCLIIYAWCSNCLVRIHLLLVIFGVFLQIPPGLEHNLFDSIACWILHKLKRRFRFLIGQRHGGEKKIGFNDAKKQQMICLDVSQWHAIKSCHVLSYLQGGPLPVTNRFKTPYE